MYKFKLFSFLHLESHDAKIGVDTFHIIGSKITLSFQPFNSAFSICNKNKNLDYEKQNEEKSS